MVIFTNSLADIDETSIPIFAKESYLKSFSDNYGWFKDENFLLPAIIKKKYFFKYITFTNNTISFKENKDFISEKSFLNQVIDLLKKSDIDFITQPPTNVLFNTYPDNSLFCNFGSYVINLKEDEEILFNNIHSKHKNVIRKAIKDNVIIERDIKFKDICYDIINKTLSNQGISFFKLSEFEKLFNLCNKNIEFFVSKRNETYEGAAIIPWDNNSAYYLYGGAAPEHHLGAMNLLHWEAIKYFKQLGLKNYNLVGARINPNKETKTYRIQEFKKRFGGKLIEGYLWKYDMNPYKKLLFDNLILLKTHKKSKDIIDSERKKLK